MDDRLAQLEQENAQLYQLLSEVREDAARQLQHVAEHLYRLAEREPQPDRAAAVRGVAHLLATGDSGYVVLAGQTGNYLHEPLEMDTKKQSDKGTST